jgi:hypothetical protein
LELISSFRLILVAPGPQDAIDHSIKVILDTNIGSDVDNAMRIFHELRTSDIQIVGLMISYVLTTIRAIIIHRLLMIVIRSETDIIISNVSVICHIQMISYLLCRFPRRRISCSHFFFAC